MEELWLSPTRVSLRDRIAAESWTPEPASSSCARCGRGVGLHEETEFGCASCANKKLAWSRAVRLGAYEGELASWVQEVKFERAWRLGEELGAMLGARLRASGFEGVVVPMPMTWRRRMLRGTDHARAIATGVARALDSRVVPALARAHRRSQRALSIPARRSNMSGVFRCRAGALRRIGGRDVVVIDDVMTSGATMGAACRSLHKARGDSIGSIWCGLVAVTPLG